MLKCRLRIHFIPGRTVWLIHRVCSGATTRAIPRQSVRSSTTRFTVLRIAAVMGTHAAPIISLSQCVISKRPTYLSSKRRWWRRSRWDVGAAPLSRFPPRIRLTTHLHHKFCRHVQLRSVYQPSIALGFGIPPQLRALLCIKVLCHHQDAG